MTLFYYYGSGDLGNAAVRLGIGFSLTECAEMGVVGSSRVAIDDLTGALSLVGLKTFRVAETAATAWPRFFTGYVADRTIKRDYGNTVTTARVWDTTVLDLNAALNFEVIRGTAANRPAETDIQRITWWLASGYAGPVRDAGFIDSGGAVNMDATDYRGRFGADVMSDASQISGKNHFVAWDDTTQQAALHYYAAGSSLNTCALKISNVAADVDGSTIFAPSKDAALFRDPSRIYSGIYLAYGTGESSVYVNDAGTASTFASRDESVTDPTVNTATKATTKATQLLAAAASEFDKITVTLHKVPAAVVNSIRVGQRIQVKFTHMPSYTAYTYIRISRRTVAQDGETDAFYALTLELSNTKASFSRGGHDPAPNPDGTLTVIDDTTPSLTVRGTDEQAWVGGSAFQYYTPATPRAGSAVSPNTAYTVCGCPLGNGGYGPGTFEEEVWYEFNPGVLDDDWIGVEFTWGIAPSILGQADFLPLYVGFSDHQPTFIGDYTPVGLYDATTGSSVLIPRALLTASVVNYVCVAAGWQANRNVFFCAQDLIDPSVGPKSGGEGMSGVVDVPSCTAKTRVMSGEGITGWVSGRGAVNGTNRDFTLIGWTGKGDVQAAINGVNQPATSYSVDASTSVVTFDAAPVEGDVPLFKYRFGG